MRVSEIYDADKLTFFAKDAPVYSTMQQGELGDCYYLAALVALDNRVGALEKLFINPEINSKGIYGMHINING